MNANSAYESSPSKMSHSLSPGKRGLSPSNSASIKDRNERLGRRRGTIQQLESEIEESERREKSGNKLRVSIDEYSNLRRLSASGGGWGMEFFHKK